ncbi:hypothetical protein BJ166DRAFT_47156 [Pestalotiopsis sp. NC0098]|nr:hypothetical protein BJ166DRAFT_47156 [Pestalotiopsis sp. NC0098]
MVSLSSSSSSPGALLSLPFIWKLTTTRPNNCSDRTVWYVYREIRAAASTLYLLITHAKEHHVICVAQNNNPIRKRLDTYTHGLDYVPVVELLVSPSLFAIHL